MAVGGLRSMPRPGTQQAAHVMLGQPPRALDSLPSHKPTVSPLMKPLVRCHIQSFQRASRVARPCQGGEKTTAVWVSHHEALYGDGVVAPPVCAHMVVPCRWVVLDGCNPSGSAVDAGLDAAAWARRAERAPDGGVVDVPRAFSGSPRAPRINAQRGAQFAPYNTHNCLPPKKLCREIQ